MTGHEYADLVARYIVKNYASRGVKVYREVSVGKTLTGRGRRVDVFVLEPSTRTALAIECKFQGSVGTVDEKIPFALQDLESMRIPCCVVYAGDGFSQGILHILSASPIAAGAGLHPRHDLQVVGRARARQEARGALTFPWKGCKAALP